MKWFLVLFISYESGYCGSTLQRLIIPERTKKIDFEPAMMRPRSLPRRSQAETDPDRARSLLSPQHFLVTTKLLVNSLKRRLSRRKSGRKYSEPLAVVIFR